MTYKVKKNKKCRTQKFPDEYYREREISELRKKYHGNIPITKIALEGQRISAGYPKKTHRVGSAVIYKGRSYLVTCVSKDGVHLRLIKKSRKGLLEDFKLGKEKFISEKKYSGKAVPQASAVVLAPA